MSLENTHNGRSWSSPPAPYLGKNFSSGSSGTYQATTHLNKRHYFCASVACYILGGTGASVSVSSTTGVYWPANIPFYFVPRADRESFGWVTADASSIAGGLVGVVE